jgi:GDPmannose 4,6-dehydratase
VREFVAAAAAELGMKIRWQGRGVKEVSILDSVEPRATSHETRATYHVPRTTLKKGSVIVAVDPRYFRPTEVDSLLGDASKARKQLGWRPRVRFRELVTEMVREDYKLAERDELIRRHGHRAFSRGE